MPPLSKTRIESIDLLKGLVMVIMALDHVRDYFHYDAFFFDPTDPLKSNLAIFFTRWITHYCAPTFSFLAGLSAYLVGKRKSKAELSSFLLKRGLWLVVIELTIVNFAWFFDIQYRTPGLIVIWVLGISMIVLAGLVHLPKYYILAFSCILIFGHNLLDGLHFPGNIFWSVLHEFNVFDLSNTRHLLVAYPIIPWIAVMSLGYYFGNFYERSVESASRKRVFNIIGVIALMLFFILRFTNWYGDPNPWIKFEFLSQNIISFMNPSKYPPSLLYLLMTLGGGLLLLANLENAKGKVVDFFATFGRVPFFYYILHIYLIHLLAMGYSQLAGFGWEKLITPFWITEIPEMKGYGLGLGYVYLMWIGVIAFLYPFCKMFDNYKINHKEKWWLSYL